MHNTTTEEDLLTHAHTRFPFRNIHNVSLLFFFFLRGKYPQPHPVPSTRQCFLTRNFTSPKLHYINEV